MERVSRLLQGGEATPGLSVCGVLFSDLVGRTTFEYLQVANLLGYSTSKILIKFFV